MPEEREAVMVPAPCVPWMTEILPEFAREKSNDGVEVVPGSKWIPTVALVTHTRKKRRSVTPLGSVVRIAGCSPRVWVSISLIYVGSAVPALVTWMLPVFVCWRLLSKRASATGELL